IEKLISRIWWPVGIVALIFAILGVWQTGLFAVLSPIKLILAILVFVSFGLSYVFVRNKKFRLAFIGVSLTIVLGAVVFFVGLFPNVLISSIDVAYNLTIYNASSSQATLRIMAIVALIFVPIVLGYQGWSYYVFSKRISRETILQNENPKNIS
ncbi:MAG TPA: cytochrome d ubiquinol oxidase subunit II, partial [Bacteroidales bacterium]|nr:cytochrome d ubiquinol oxidase subunit II [Bacteroidales bacterium]